MSNMFALEAETLYTNVAGSL